MLGNKSKKGEGSGSSGDRPGESQLLLRKNGTIINHSNYQGCVVISHGMYHLI
jgi:hypothetical protein